MIMELVGNCTKFRLLEGGKCTGSEFTLSGSVKLVFSYYQYCKHRHANVRKTP